MAMSKKCDRCGKFYDHYPEKNLFGTYNAVSRLRVDKFGSVRSYGDIIDLCPDCMEKFEIFLSNGGDANAKQETQRLNVQTL